MHACAPAKYLTSLGVGFVWPGMSYTAFTLASPSLLTSSFLTFDQMHKAMMRGPCMRMRREQECAGITLAFGFGLAAGSAFGLAGASNSFLTCARQCTVGRRV